MKRPNWKRATQKYKEEFEFADSSLTVILRELHRHFDRIIKRQEEKGRKSKGKIP